MCGLERKTKILWGKGEEGWGMEGSVKGIKGEKRYRGFLLAWFNKASKEICKALAGLHGFNLFLSTRVKKTFQNAQRK